MTLRERDRRDMRGRILGAVRALAAPPPPRKPSLAGVHEAAHERIAKAYGCRDVRAFVYMRDSGRCYQTCPPTHIRDVEGKLIPARLSNLRAQIAVLMAGWMGEYIAQRRPIPSSEELIVLEHEDSDVFDNSLHRLLAAATYEFHSVDDAMRWLTIVLPATREKVWCLLRNNWSAVERRALQLDREAGLA